MAVVVACEWGGLCRVCGLGVSVCEFLKGVWGAVLGGWAEWWVLLGVWVGGGMVCVVVCVWGGGGVGRFGFVGGGWGLLLLCGGG